MGYSIHHYKSLDLIKVGNKRSFCVYLSNLGASIHSIYFDNKIMTLTPRYLKDFLKPNIYHGKTTGPINGRIKDGEIKVRSKVIRFKKNEGNNTLHSSNYFIGNEIFDYDIDVLNDDQCHVKFSYVGPNLNGLEGHISYHVEYLIDLKNYTIRLCFNAFSNETFTLLALTNHSYFTLGSTSLDELMLKVPSKRYIEPNKDDLLLGETKDIIPCLDFNEFKKVTKDIENPYLIDSKTYGYDHCWILDKPIVYLKNNQYQMEISSTYPNIVIYSDNYLSMPSKNKVDLDKRRALAMEPVDKITLFEKNQPYQKEITYTFKKIS